MNYTLMLIFAIGCTYVKYSIVVFFFFCLKKFIRDIARQMNHLIRRNKDYTTLRMEFNASLSDLPSVNENLMFALRSFKWSWHKSLLKGN